ncbi:MAG: hypothetical protein JWQ98_1131 [Chlorobi bacterium]|nr:hypothetical protein [Chlorobiota bacterium]
MTLNSVVTWLLIMLFIGVVIYLLRKQRENDGVE